jgi:hypothetical protein
MSSSTAAVLSVIAEHVDRYRHEVADLAPHYAQAERDDVVAAIYEAERALVAANRLLRRAAKLAE